jgi:gp16 family phage-associated protein
MTTLKTRAQVRKEFARLGMSVAEWARQHQVNQPDVYQLLRGRNKGTRGQSHRIAVMLGLKDGVL